MWRQRSKILWMKDGTITLNSSIVKHPSGASVTTLLNCMIPRVGGAQDKAK